MILAFVWIVGIIAILSFLSLFGRDVLGDRQKYEQLAAVCIASIISWAVVLVTLLIMAK